MEMMEPNRNINEQKNCRVCTLCCLVANEDYFIIWPSFMDSLTILIYLFNMFIICSQLHFVYILRRFGDMVLFLNYGGVNQFLLPVLCLLFLDSYWNCQ